MGKIETDEGQHSLCPQSHISGCKGNYPEETVSSDLCVCVHVCMCLIDGKVVFNVYGELKDPNEWVV